MIKNIINWLRFGSRRAAAMQAECAVLEHLEVTNQGISTIHQVDPKIAMQICKSFAMLLADAPNYMTYALSHPDLKEEGAWAEVVIQRTNRETPAQKAHRLTEENKQLQAEVEALKDRWIPVTESLPEPGQLVLFTTGVDVVLGLHYPKHYEEGDGDWFEGDLDWSDDKERSYFPEGWYEYHQWGDTGAWGMTPATHWIPLPIPPGKEGEK